MFSNEPAVPSKITHLTDLKDLNLDWQEKDLPEKERTRHVHRLHPYLGKYIPQLVEVFLRKYFIPGQTILDPFCGSGTTLVQANELAINSIGCDISAFNVMLCRAKTDSYNLARLRKEVLDILDKAQNTIAQIRPTSNHIDIDNNYLRKWFAPPALRELLIYKGLIDAGDYEYKNLLKIILSRSARSARLTTHYELDLPARPQTEPYWCYKHSRTCMPTTEAFKFLRRYSLDTISRIEQFAQVRTPAVVSVYHQNSLEADFPPVDGVITSPPYVGLIDYHQQHAYAYQLLGLEDRREQEIGPAVNGAGKKARRQYQEEIAAVFRRAAASMPVGGRMIVIANDKLNLYGEIANLVGVEVEDVVKRRVNRRTGRRSSEFYESIFIWKKN